MCNAEQLNVRAHTYARTHTRTHTHAHTHTHTHTVSGSYPVHGMTQPDEVRTTKII